MAGTEIRSSGSRRAGFRMVAGADPFGYGFITLQNPSWTLAQVLLATGGRFCGGGWTGQCQFRSISTDTRSLEAGDLFLALTGARHDGHLFLEEAVRKGAGGILVSRPPGKDLNVPVIVVPDTLAALGDLAAYRRSLMPCLRVAAVTGSSGKTTVKEMTAAILERKFNILKTKGNFNNLVGLPLSLLPVDNRHEFAVLEMGMNGFGEIARLTRIADPDVCCITNIQEAHLEGVGDIKGVARAKGELFENVKTWATLVVNMDDRRVRRLALAKKNRRITFGFSRGADVRATHIRSVDTGSAFTLHMGWRKKRVHLKVVGKHNVLNSLSAAAMASSLGVNLDAIVAGLEAFQSQDKRLQMEKLPGGIGLVNDAYNANPASMRAAFAALKEMAGKKARALLVLGDMLELGLESARIHHALGKELAAHGFTYLAAHGPHAREIASGAREGDMDMVRFFPEKAAIAPWVGQLVKTGELAAGDWILVKGSRGMRLETVVDDLRALMKRNGE